MTQPTTATALTTTEQLRRELADTRRTLTAVKQQRDRLHNLWSHLVTNAANIERALIAAGFDHPTGREAALIAELAAHRDALAAQLASEVKP